MHINSNPVDVGYRFVGSRLNIKHKPLSDIVYVFLASSLSVKWHMSENTEDLRFRKELFPNLLFPQEPPKCCHSRCSGVATLSLVVSVSRKNNPDCAGIQRWRRWWGGDPLFWMAHVFQRFSNSYGSQYNQDSLVWAVTWQAQRVAVEESWVSKLKPGW